MNIITTQLLASAKWPKYMKDDRIIIRFGNGYFVGKILTMGKTPKVLLDNKIEVTPKPKDIVGYAKMGLFYKKRKPIPKSKLMKYKVKYPESLEREKIIEKQMSNELKKYFKKYRKDDELLKVIRDRNFNKYYDFYKVNGKQTLYLENEDNPIFLGSIIKDIVSSGWKTGKISKTKTQLLQISHVTLVKGNNKFFIISLLPKSRFAMQQIYMYLIK